MDLTDRVLNFWFGSLDIITELEPRKIWFKSTPEFDQEIRWHFRENHKDAVSGHLDNMRTSQKCCLALIIILDQFSRNLFRGSPQAFSADSKARETTYHAINEGFDSGLNRVARLFFYLPLEHSENLKDQEMSLKLLNQINDKRASKAAKEHYNKILRFGRFPHRNVILGRKNTPEEDSYLNNLQT